jgi:transposase-like protein
LDLVCRRCGISRPTLRKWWRRYQALGQAGLIEQSRAPLRPAARKVDVEMEALILDLRRTRSLGVKRLRNELIRQHDLQLRSTPFIASSFGMAPSILIRRASVVRAPGNIRVPSQATACGWTSAKSRREFINTRRSMIVAATRYLAFIQDEMQRALCPSLSASWRKCRFLSSAFRLIAGSSSLPKMSNAG